MKFAYLLAAGLFFAAVSCERHSWEDTKVLHETHGHDEHHEDHGHDDHGHGEEKAEHGSH